MKKYITILILCLNVACFLTGCTLKVRSDNMDNISENIIEDATNMEETDRPSDNINSDERTMEVLKTERPLYPVFIDGSYDYVDLNGNVITDYNFEKAEFFREGRASVRLNGKYGFMDENGDIVIDCRYNQSGSFFNDGLCAVTEDGEKWGYIDIYGNKVIDCKYNYASVFSEGTAQVQLDSQHYAYIDRHGRIIRETYNMGGDCHNGMASTYENTYMCVSTGNCILEDFARIGEMHVCPFSEGMAVFNVYNPSGTEKENPQEQFYDEKNWEYYYVDLTGNLILGPYEAAAPFREGRAIVLDQGHVKCITKNGSAAFEINIPEKYQYEIANMMFFEGLLYYVDENGKYGFVDHDGNVVIEARYDWIARNFENGVAVCMNGDKYEFIHKDGTTIFETSMFETRYDTDYWWWEEE